jgi:Ca-activated chloride channel family protein
VRTEISSLLSALAALLMIMGAALSLRWQRRVP